MPPPIKPDISISIVSWNTKELLCQCLQSIKDTTSELKVEVIVVDNNSSDESAQMVKKEFPQVTTIANKNNKGFAAGNNQAILASKSDYILFLNPDIVVLPGAIQNMLKFIKSDRTIGAVGCRLLNRDSSVQEKGFFRRYPTLIQVLLYYTFLEKIFLKIPFFCRRYFENVDVENGCLVDQTPGACTLVRRDIIDTVGLWDEGYKLFFEDVDFCFRIKKAGFHLHYYTGAEMIHIGMQSFNTWKGLDIHIRFNSSLILFLKKHRGFCRAAMAYFIITTNELIKNFVKLFIFPFYNIKKNRKRTIRESFYFLSCLGKVLLLK